MVIDPSDCFVICCAQHCSTCSIRQNTVQACMGCVAVGSSADLTRVTRPTASHSYLAALLQCCNNAVAACRVCTWTHMLQSPTTSQQSMASFISKCPADSKFSLCLPANVLCCAVLCVGGPVCVSGISLLPSCCLRMSQLTLSSTTSSTATHWRQQQV